MLLTLAVATIFSASSTGYCLSGTMADGSQVRPHSVAMNNLPLGTEIRLVKPKEFYGQRRFWVRDRIGHGTELDFWTGDCKKAIKWGRKTVTYKIVKRAKV